MTIISPQIQFMIKQFLSLILIFSFFSVSAQNFNGTMSREVLHNYLEHGMQTQGLIDEFRIQNTGGNVTPPSLLNYNADVNMLADLDVRLIGRVGGLWGWERRINGDPNATSPNSPTQYFNDLDLVVKKINLAYAAKGHIKPICEAAIFEIVTVGLQDGQPFGTIEIPNDIATEFGYNKQGPDGKYFDYEKIKNQTLPFGNSPYECWVDINRIQAQMWYYYLATNYIDAGIECLSFNQTNTTGINDPTGQIFFDLVTKIKTYAASKNRGVVLTAGDPKKKAGTEELVFDFQRFPIRMRNVANNWGDPYRGGPTVIDYEASTLCNDGIVYRQKFPGKTRFGWHTEDIYKVVEIDNANSGYYTGLSLPCGLWGFDEITWFTRQPEDYQCHWMKYLYYKIKCLDENVSLEMMARRGNYRAWDVTASVHKMPDLVKDLWHNHTYDLPDDWVYHNFTDIKVYNPNNPPNAETDLVFAGTDKIFYIGDDGFIYGYYIDNGAWKTVSPSYSAQDFHNQPVNTQVKAQGNLVVSPDGKRLVYQGVDGFLYGFEIINGWDYVFDNSFPHGSSVVSGNKTVVYANDHVIYYIANDAAGGPNGGVSKRVHGLVRVNNSWVSTSPSWAATSPPSGVAAPIQSQIQALDYLTISPDKNLLIYKAADGHTYGYNILNDWDYTYNSSFPAVIEFVKTGYTFFDNDKFFFVDKDHKVRGMSYDGTSWNVFSVIDFSQTAAPANDLALSPTGLLAYTGTDQRIHAFQIKKNGTYKYRDFVMPHDPVHPLLTAKATYFTIDFKNENELFFISAEDKKVHMYELHQPYCLNDFTEDIMEKDKEFPNRPPGEGEIGGEGGRPPVIERKRIKENPTLSSQSGKDIAVYPNPANDHIIVDLPGENPNYSIQIINSNGAIINKKTAISATEIIDISDLAAGLYFVEIKDNNNKNVVRKKVTKL
jgi:hypothetical protein